VPVTCDWFSKLGFDVWTIPGCSRAWRYEFDDGSYVLVTDLGGYDLPESGGPYSAISLSSSDEMIECQEWLHSTKALLDWFRHITRLCAFRVRRRDQSSTE